MINADNDKKLKKLILSLNHKLSPTVYFISTNTEKLHKQLHQSITTENTRFQHIDVDLTPHSVYSLRDAISRFVPDEVKSSPMMTYVVHFTGLSASLFTSKDGELKKTMLLEELNFEREVIFQDYPFISVIWMNPYFYKELFWKAGDLMSWVFDRYEFEDDSPDGMVQYIPYHEPLQKQGAIVERTERIIELEDLADRLEQSDQEQIKIMLQQMNVYTLLGREYMAAFGWQKAEEYLLKAKNIAERIVPGSNQQLDIFFYLGDLYTTTRHFDKAISNYSSAMNIAQNINQNSVGVIYHQIGIAYAEQHLWKEAFANYNKAIECDKKNGNDYGLGNTYHQIGWAYAKQGLWEDALANYFEAINWKEKTGNLYDLGSTYHQIGMAYAEQQRWEDALKSYDKAIERKEKSNNVYELGSTYHQIGRLYEEKGSLTEAKKNYQTAIENFKKYNHPFLPAAEESLARINEKLKHT